MIQHPKLFRMRHFLIIIYLLGSSYNFAQNITGSWSGDLEIPDNPVRVIFTISSAGEVLTSTVDIPMQGLTDYKIESTLFEDSILTIKIPEMQIVYSGTFDGNNDIIGELSQGGRALPLNLSRGKVELNRPQEPKAPFDYFSEEVMFINKEDKIKLSGTLTLPEKGGNFPIAIIVSGSGPQNRDGAIFGHKPYLLIAHKLTQNGIGVLRFDERGVGDSEGDFSTATIESFSKDVKSAIDYLKTRKEVNTSQIGLIGHSLGGLIAPKVAVETGEINFVVLLAAPIVNGDQLMLSQKAAAERIGGLPEEAIIEGKETFGKIYDFIRSSDKAGKELGDDLNEMFRVEFNGALSETEISSMTQQLVSPEMLGIIRSTASINLIKLNCPTLALWGDKDFQVSSEQNSTELTRIIEESEKDNYKVVVLENLNHLFQECSTGGIEEYPKIEQTISPDALDALISWVKQKTE